MPAKDEKPKVEGAALNDEKEAPATIWVTSGRDDKSLVVLWEKDDVHPKGEAFVDGNTPPVEVGRSAKVMALLGSRDLVEVPAADAKQQWAAWKETKRQERFDALVESGVPEEQAAKITGLKAK